MTGIRRPRRRGRARTAGALAALLVTAAGCGSAETAAPVVPAAPVAEQVTIGQVVDGDTFTVADGRTVRVLGIDACEVGTPAGDQARDKAVDQFDNAYNQPVTLTREPGVEANPQGMLLRYVQLRGYDYSEQMVPFDHTGAAPGDPGGRAAVSYTTWLQGMDTRQSYQSPPVARDCDGPDQPAPAPTPAPEPTTSSPPTSTEQYDGDDGDDADRPVVPRPRRDSDDGGGGGSSGGDGHPCGPGERDGDGDGRCGES